MEPAYIFSRSDKRTPDRLSKSRHAQIEAASLIRNLGAGSQLVLGSISTPNGRSGMQWNELGDQDCSMARTLSVIGDRWTLLILRECFLRVRRFDDFQERLGIGRPILADRLQKLIENFVLTKIAYQQNPTRYEYRLTAKGRDLYPVVLSIVHWGDVHLAGKKGRPVLHQHVGCGHVFDPVMRCSACEAELEARDVRVLPGPGMRSEKRLRAEKAVRTKQA